MYASPPPVDDGLAQTGEACRLEAIGRVGRQDLKGGILGQGANQTMILTRNMDGRGIIPARWAC
jgi:hypothetical protein